ncbi:hypothetical protein CAPTEDRAFT_193082 [Capitella teleta]|uniref:DNA topoisomerase n=1 Tax=Capitella teleta TaxID=283909 RepID=R7TJU1_CAPTE|nr:hypothetical protein CAPTEDRAFT_193082 [Capitella teleta]|eukprot:ELT93762.1 hypothetical protein CAPTEDRAFT_193082 [Capitella teleta]
MVRILNVAEKNDAAKTLAGLMSGGRSRKREGFSKFNKIYEFDYNLFNQNCTMSMTSVSGHLLGCEFEASHRKWHSCNPVSLFDAPIHKTCPENYKDIKRTLEREARGCEILVVWTDCDREGENIGFEVIQVCTAVKPNMRVYRARFSEMTPGAVTRAIANLQPPDKNVSDAVDVRQELDLRIGASFTRFQTMRLQKVFPNVLADQLISYGSCQFPTLGFVVERYKQVQAFIPEPFWKIKVSHDLQDDGFIEFSWRRGRLFDYEACLVLYEHVIENPLATVLEVKKKPKSKWRPVALDTVELEKLASRKLRINAKETMKIAEKLYTQGFISYPRTETNIFPKDLNLRNLIQQQVNDQDWGEFAGHILEDGPNPRNGNKTDQAHPPIHPTKYTNGLQGNEKRVYEFVVRHFLACCSKDAQGQETTVDISINDEYFSASGLMIIARNYLDVYPYDKWTGKILPTMEEGAQFTPRTIEMNQGETSAPSLLTEADLISLMDKHGIGTDATHAEHIETIKARLYVGLTNDQKFIPGELGMGLVEGYDAMGFHMSKPHLRAELENDLKLICEGKKNRDVVLADQIRKYKEVFVEACTQAEKIDTALAEHFGAPQQLSNQDLLQATAMAITVKPCSKCGMQMSLRTKKDNKGFFIGCSGYPTCREVIWLPDYVLKAEVTEEVCPHCQPGPVNRIRFQFKRGSVPPFIPNDYTGCIGGCDNNLMETLQIRRSSQSAAQPSQPTSSQRPAASQRPAPSQRPALSQAPPSRRPFYACSKSQDDSSKCNFFLWADNQEPTTQRSNDSGFSTLKYYNNPGGNRTSAITGAGDGSVSCQCGQEGKLLTVQKVGPNQGRQFYACPKPRGQGCNFFQWGDDAAAPTNYTAPRGGGYNASQRGGYQPGLIGGRGGGHAQSNGSTTTAQRAPRKCGQCRQTGHTKKNCPMNR